MGCSLLKWGSYAHLQLQPVLSDQTIHITFIVLMFLTSNYELIPSMWLKYLLLGVFGSYKYFVSNPRSIISKRCCRPCPNWKLTNIWCRRKLHYCIACRYRRQPRQCPHCLYVSFFLLPQCTKYQVCRRGGAHARAFFDRRHMD